MSRQVEPAFWHVRSLSYLLIPLSYLRIKFLLSFNSFWIGLSVLNSNSIPTYMELILDLEFYKKALCPEVRYRGKGYRICLCFKWEINVDCSALVSRLLVCGVMLGHGSLSCSIREQLQKSEWCYLIAISYSISKVIPGDTLLWTWSVWKKKSICSFPMRWLPVRVEETSIF